MKFATKPIRHHPPHLRHVATLPWHEFTNVARPTAVAELIVRNIYIVQKIK